MIAPLREISDQPASNSVRKARRTVARLLLDEHGNQAPAEPTIESRAAWMIALWLSAVATLRIVAVHWWRLPPY